MPEAPQNRNAKRKQRVDAEKKAGEYRTKESKTRAEAAKARQAASKTNSDAELPRAERQGERYNRTLASEWAYRQVVISNADCAAALPDSLDYFRGRDGHCWPPPAQIPACAFNALGS